MPLFFFQEGSHGDYFGTLKIVIIEKKITYNVFLVRIFGGVPIARLKYFAQITFKNFTNINFVQQIVRGICRH